jgi:AcrR family transcriptional regulator
MRYKKSEISVAHIVEATMRVLARQGYAHTSLMDIAKEVGMSKGAVHYHFPTKEALITQVLQHAVDAVAERTRKVWTASENPLLGMRSALRELWAVRSALSDDVKVVADLLAQYEAGHYQPALEGMRASTEPYALLLARTARERFQSTWAIAETGATGPTGNRYGDASGHACLALAGPLELARTLETGSDDRVANMHAFTSAALNLLLEALRR